MSQFQKSLVYELEIKKKEWFVRNGILLQLVVMWKLSL
jgi:hypothetical protein